MECYISTAFIPEFFAQLFFFISIFFNICLHGAITFDMCGDKEEG